MKLVELVVPGVSDYNNYAAFATSKYLPENLSVRIRKALEALEALKGKLDEGHAENIPIIEKNKEARAKIIELMKEIEMPSTYRIIDKKSRAKYTKYVTVNAGYIGDMERELPIEDYYDYHCRRYEAAKRTHTQALEAALAAEEKAAQAEAREKERKDAEAVDNYERVPLLIKYGLAPTDTWETIYDILIEKSPLLALADAMVRACIDYSEGDKVWSYITDDISKEIRAAVQESCEAWEGCRDGTVFQGGEWNYNDILGLIGRDDADLLADYTKVISKVGYR